MRKCLGSVSLKLFLVVLMTGFSFAESTVHTVKTKRDESKTQAPFLEGLNRAAIKKDVAPYFEQMKKDFAEISHLPLSAEVMAGLLTQYVEEKALDPKPLLDFITQEAKFSDYFKKLLTEMTPKKASESAKSEAKQTFSVDKKKVTWLVKNPDGSQVGMATEGNGFMPASVDKDGKEVLPPHHMAVKWNEAKQKFQLFVTSEDGKLIPYPTIKLPGNPPVWFTLGGLMGASRESIYLPEDYQLPGEETEILLPELALNFVANPIPIDDMITRVRTQFAAFDDLFKRSEARMRMHQGNMGERDMVKVGPGEAFDIIAIEEALEIGSAKKEPTPIDFGWIDPSTQQFFVVDEVKGKAYWQIEKVGKTEMTKYRILSPTEFGFPKQDGSALSSKGERKWFLKAPNGKIFTVDTAADSKPTPQAMYDFKKEQK